MAKRKMEVGSKVKHKEHGNGRIVVVHERTGQCNAHFANGAICVCPMEDLKLVSTAGTRRLQSTVNKLKEF